jgi:hypothetical protein
LTESSSAGELIDPQLNNTIILTNFQVAKKKSNYSRQQKYLNYRLIKTDIININQYNNHRRTISANSYQQSYWLIKRTQHRPPSVISIFEQALLFTPVLHHFAFFDGVKKPPKNKDSSSKCTVK